MFRTKPIADQVAVIYRDHSPFLWRLLRVRGISEGDVPDALHEIFVKVMRALPTYQERGSLKGWLYTIADLHIRQCFRSEGRRQRRMTLYARDVSGCSDGEEPDEHVKRSEATLLIQHFMDGLPEAEREVFLLSWVEGMPGPEVARLLCLNINTLYGREKRIREKFASFSQRLALPRASGHA